MAFRFEEILYRGFIGKYKMNLFIKFVVFLLVLALAAPFILKGSEGRPLVSFRDVQNTGGGFSKGIEKAQTLLSGSIKSIFNSSQAFDDLPGGSEMQSGAESFQVHYWKDENGVFHFSDEKNLNGDSELKIITNDATIVEINNKELMSKLEKIYNSNPLDENTGSATGLSFPDLSSGSLSLKDIFSTIDKAKEVQSVVDERHNTQNTVMDAL